jgi:N-acetylglucosaminyldiphosphoundecaprenol N-acetyl-beta-D-mannosaminyltransferase
MNKPWSVHSILGLAIDCPTAAQLQPWLLERIAAREPVHVVTVNAEMAYAAALDAAQYQLLSQADVIIPDGIGVVWALRRQGVAQERLPGVELVESLLRHSGQQGAPAIYILGSSQATLDALKDIIPARFGPAHIVGMRNGFFTAAEEAEIVAGIQAAAPDVLLVALGVPKQEQFIARHRQALNVPLMMGVGGSFDVISGRLQRAPLWMRRLHLEWFYRLLQQPSRWRRMLALPKFVLKVLATR